MDHTYMSPIATTSTNMSMSATRGQHQTPSQAQSPEEQMRRQLDELNRSVTIVIWYKADHEPIRLQQILPTFPYFQLSGFSNIISDLGLSSTSYLDTYIPDSSQWEQHTISSVRVVSTQQRLLYRVRRSLVEGLSEDQCPRIQDELQMQSNCGPPPPPPVTNGASASSIPTPPKSSPTLSKMANPPKPSLKRPAPDVQESGNNSKIHVTNGYYMAHSSSPTMVPSSSVAGPPNTDTSSPTASTNQSNAQAQDSVYLYNDSVFYAPGSPTQSPNDITSATSINSLPHYLIQPPAPAPPIPYHPHPPLKRWPNDYTVSELSQGFHAMDLLISHSPSGASMTQRTAFERVFGSRYVKSTVCRHRAVWRKAHRALREQFEAMGSDDRACWGEFVRRVEGRPPGKNSGSDMMSPSPSATMSGYHDQQEGEGDEDVHGQEGVGVMGSLQNQGVPSSSNSNGNNNMQNNMNVYDPSRNHMPNGTHNN